MDEVNTLSGTIRSDPFNLARYLSRLNNVFPDYANAYPWELTGRMQELIHSLLMKLGSDYTIRDGVATHRSAGLEPNVIVKGPAIISKNCFVGANAYLRGGVFLDENVRVGPGCEIKSSMILANSATAHFNFVGDSLIGAHVNMEAGAVIANHYNERGEKIILANINASIISTGVTKFGALVGDHSKIGANAVLSPGTILPSGSVVKRLELVDQCAGR